MIKINYLFLALLLVNFYGMQKNELSQKLPILSKKETIKNFLFNEFHKGLGVGLVGAGFFYGSMGMMSLKSPFFKEIQKNKKFINALTLIVATLPTVKNFYAYRKFARDEDYLFNQVNQLDESYYLSPDPFKVLAMRTLKLEVKDTYDFIFLLLDQLSFKAVKNIRKNLFEKAFFQTNSSEINEIFKAAIKEHFEKIVKSLQLNSDENQKDYDSTIKFFLLDIDNMEKNSENINKSINSFKANNCGENFEYHPFENTIIKMTGERKKSLNREECFNLCLLLFSNKWNLVAKAPFLFVLLTNFLLIDKDKRDSQLAKIEKIIIDNKLEIKPIKDLLKKLILKDKDYKNYLENLSEKISDKNIINAQIFKIVLDQKTKQSGFGEKIINFLFS